MGRIKNKAQFFTIDALVALTIIIITVIAIAPVLEQQREESIITADILESLNSLSIGDFNNAYAQQLISDGKISNPSKSLLKYSTLKV